MGRPPLTQYQLQPAETPVLAFTALLSDQEVADILIMTVEWVRSRASEIPGLERLGMYYRFHSKPIEQWLGSLDRLLDADQVAALLKVPPSWVYANADQIPGVLRLGRYIRFRPTVIAQFLSGSEACQ
jgi:predicted DNA-binding transcriptional regulator AlpA